MSRSKRKNKTTGTRKGRVLAGRNRQQGKIDRLIASLHHYLRRFGLVAALSILILWGGAWVILSGAAGRMAVSLENSFYEVTANHGFIVHDVLVEGRKYADPQILLGLLDVNRGDPIFAFDPRMAQMALQRENWVESVRVERRLPGLVYVALTEREPFALWQSQGKLRLIDPKGIVITDHVAEMAKFQTLPLVVGEGAQMAAMELFDLIRAEPVLTQRIEAATYIGARRWDLKLKNNIAVRLPEKDVGLALRRLANAQEMDLLLDKELESIDLRESGRLVVRTRPGAVQEYQAGFRAGKAI